jgi:hypothetical protein
MQRAMVAAKLANMPHGGDRSAKQAANLPVASVTQPAAAELLHVSSRSVRDEGTPELVQRVESGEIAVSLAGQGVVTARSAKPMRRQPQFDFSCRRC